MPTPTADHLLLSEAVHTGAGTEGPVPGYVALRADRILAVGTDDPGRWQGPHTEVHDLGDRLVSPGFHDSHTFFTGTLLTTRGVDLSACPTVRDGLAALLAHAGRRPPDAVLTGHGWDAARWGGTPDPVPLDRHFPDQPVALFDTERVRCWMNAAARRRYGFAPDRCHAEALAPLLRDLLADQHQTEQQLMAFARELATRGVTSVKDVVFDDSLGLLPLLRRLDDSGGLPLRMSVASQPVSAPADLDFADRARARLRSGRLRFAGLKLMTDGTVPDLTADLLEPYTCAPAAAHRAPVDWETVRATALAADARGIDVLLNADGDAAVRACVDILEECRRVNAPRDRRDGLSDVSLCSDQDAARIGRLGLSVEVYTQFLTLFPDLESSFLPACLGPERAHRFNNFAALAAAGTRPASGTDLPLLWPSVPESLHAAHARLFAAGGPEGGWQRERGLTVGQVLDSWTVNGAWRTRGEAALGVLAPGRKADIAVLSGNPYTTAPEELRHLQVALTFLDGAVVHGA